MLRSNAAVTFSTASSYIIQPAKIKAYYPRMLLRRLLEGGALMRRRRAAADSVFGDTFSPSEELMASPSQTGQ